VLQLWTAQAAGVADVLHVGVPFCVAHMTPHEPQFPIVVSVASHPLATLLSQLPKPGLHESVHIPFEQLGVSLTVLQTLPHVPQLFGSVPVEVSQLVPGLPGQWAKPGLQLPTVHMPCTHAGVPFVVVQMLPHAPQLFGSFWVLVSQPSAGLLLQSKNPLVHAMTVHRPATQVSVALFWLHFSPQPLQFCGSLVMLTGQPVLGGVPQLA
jgi:hypothetical protein